MFSVALIGPDGAGKSTITRRLERELPLPVKYVYMGVNLEASNRMLPTTRLILELKRLGGGRPDMAGPPDPSRIKPLPKQPLKRLATELRSGLRLANLMAEEWYRQGWIWYYQRRGYIVLFDRHFFFDYYAYEIAANTPHPSLAPPQSPPEGGRKREAPEGERRGRGTNGLERPLANRVHGFMLGRFYPRPDLVICLDAPAEVLFARKGEGTPALLERRRQEYLQLREVVEHFELVDATQSEDEVAGQVTALIQKFYQNRCESENQRISESANQR